MTRPLALHVVLVFCLVAAALLAGCGGGGHQPGEDTEPDPSTRPSTQPVHCTTNASACL